MAQNLPNINLAKEKEIPFINRLMNWALTAGRLIVILTEIVAISAFVYRFSLDERLSDLHSEIKKKHALVSLLKNDENQYTNLQNRLVLASTSSEKTTKTNTIINDIVYLIPQGVRIENLLIDRDKVSLSVNTSSVDSLTGLTNSLRNYSGIKSVNVESIENKPGSGLLAEITVALK